MRIALQPVPAPFAVINGRLFPTEEVYNPVADSVPVTARPVEEKVATLAAPVPSLRIRTDSESEVPTVSMTHRFTPLVRQPKEAFPFAEAVAAITPPPVPEPVPDSEPMMVSAAPVAVTVVKLPVLGVVAPHAPLPPDALKVAATDAPAASDWAGTMTNWPCVEGFGPSAHTWASVPL